MALNNAGRTLCVYTGDRKLAPKADEMYFTTTAGSIDYVGQQGDQIFLSDGSIVDITDTNLTTAITIQAGKHKVKLINAIERNNYVSVGGEALVELHNFPTLSTVTKFNFATYDYNSVSNLTKVPESFPSNIVDIGDLFYGAINFNQDISMWDVSNVTNMAGMFDNNRAFNQPIGNWNTSNVTNMAGMFHNAIAFNQDINMWNVSNVTNMLNMFYKTSAFNQPIGSWNVSNVTDMYGMFRDATVFNQDISNWDVSNVNEMYNMFRDASAFNQNLSQWCVTNITVEPYDFSTNTPLTSQHKPVWGTCPSN